MVKKRKVSTAFYYLRMLGIIYRSGYDEYSVGWNGDTRIKPEIIKELKQYKKKVIKNRILCLPLSL